MKSISLILVLCLFFCSFVHAQRTCKTQEVLENHLLEIPEMRRFSDSYLQERTIWVRNYPMHPELQRSAVTIPVVVHIIHKNARENISDNNIRAQIEILNNAFRMRNTAAINRVPTAFRYKAADSYLQFRLAERTPLGNPTTGITRRRTDREFFTDTGEEVKIAGVGVVAWDPNRYLNIWVCDLLDTDGRNILGYATFPWDTIQRYQGVVIDFASFGPGPANPPYDHQGKTLVHEVGHFFGLKHIWGDRYCGDDEVKDTPTQQNRNFGCPSFPEPDTCSNKPEGDMFMNYMDYVDDTCMSIFTQDQRMRMLSNVAPGGTRASLAVSNALFPTNAVNRDYDVYLEPQNASLPSWKAALLMTHGWACGCFPDLELLLQQNGGQRGRLYSSVSGEIADAIFALALTPEEMLACYTIEGFYQKLSRGPIAVLSLGRDEYYGLVISGMVIDRTNGRALLKIKDPMNIGPRGFYTDRNSLAETGAEYQVDYAEFMTLMLGRAVRNNKHIYLVYPPASIEN